MFHKVRSARLSVLVVGLALLVSMWSPLRAGATSSLGAGPAQSGYTPAPYPSGWTKAAAAEDGAVPAPATGGGATAVATAPARTSLRVRDLDRRELGVVAPLIALILVLGVYPQPLLDLIEPAVSATMSDLGGSDR